MLSRLVIAGLLVAVLWSPAGSQTLRGANNKLPVLVTADNLDYDREKDIITATGKVRVSQGDNVVLADKLVYNRRTKIVTATGNVSVTRPNGETIFARRVVLADDLKDGVIYRFRMLFPDDTKIAANGAVKIRDKGTEMAKVVFSPCKLCDDDPTAAPLWQIKARKVTHDEKSKDLIYRDARLEVFGLPVFYFPYLRHPDPTVRRRTGLLAATVGNDSRLGQFAKIPYFWAISRDKDLTITPMLTSDQYAALFLTYRQRFKNGAAIVSGSFTYSRQPPINSKPAFDDARYRGHLFTKLRYDIDRNWRFSFDGAWTLDDTYLRRYDVTSTDVLVTAPRLEGFFGRNYYSVEAFVFKGLRVEDDFDKGPISIPLVTVYRYGQPIPGWGRWHFRAGANGIVRLDGVDSQRLHATIGWRLPYTHPLGWVLTVTGEVTGHLYLVNGQPAEGPGSFSGAVARLFPQAKVEWRYPFVRELGNVRHILEPRAALILAPAGLNSNRIPNEDSAEFGIDDANLFDLNRYNGRDRIEDGSRFVYGLRSAFFGNRGGRADFFLGQSIRISGFNHIDRNSFFRQTFSDIVGRIQLEPGGFLSFTYRFRMDAGSLAMRSQELGASFGVPALRASINYLDLGNDETTDDLGRKEISFGIRSQITKNWAAFGSALYDLARTTGGIRFWQLGVEFKNECCTITATFTRSFFQDREIQPTSRFLVRVVLKHLGGFGGGL